MYRFFPQKRVASCSIITRDIRKDLVLLHRLGSRVVPELEIMTVIHPSSTTKCIIVNVQPQCNGHFCWRRKLASPAVEV